MSDWARYEDAKQRWTAAHPHATPRQYQAFIRALVRKLKI